MNGHPTIYRVLYWALLALCIPGVGAAQRPGDSAQVAWIDRMERSTDSLGKLPHPKVSPIARLEDSSFRLIPDLMHLPAGTEEVYAFFRDRKGRVRQAFTSPMSRSGDWGMSIMHLFDSTGVTRLVEVRYGRETLCLDKDDESVSGIEITRLYYDATHHIIHQTLRRMGGTNDTTDLTALTNCVQADSTGYARYPTWDSMATATGLRRFVEGR